MKMTKLIFGVVAGLLVLSGCGDPSNVATPTTSTIPERPVEDPKAAGAEKTTGSSNTNNNIVE